MLQMIYESIELDKKFIKLLMYTKYLIKQKVVFRKIE